MIELSKDSFDDIAGFLLGDKDNDKVVDFLDCQPTNPRRQDSKNWFSGKGLGSYGYDVDDVTAKRRRALKKCIRDVGAMKCWQKLHGVYVTWSNQGSYSQDDITAVRRDRDWVSANYKMHR